jgi:hypothetical protein
MGVYTVLSILFILLVYRIIQAGPAIRAGKQVPRDSALVQA